MELLTRSDVQMPDGQYGFMVNKPGHVYHGKTFSGKGIYKLLNPGAKPPKPGNQAVQLGLSMHAQLDANDREQMGAAALSVANWRDVMLDNWHSEVFVAGNLFGSNCISFADCFGKLKGGAWCVIDYKLSAMSLATMQSANKLIMYEKQLAIYAYLLRTLYGAEYAPQQARLIVANEAGKIEEHVMSRSLLANRLQLIRQTLEVKQDA